MKRIIPFIVTGIAIAAIILAFKGPETSPGNIHPQDKPDLGFSEEITTMLETSCYDCHTSASSNIKAKSKLNFTNWSELTAPKKVGKLEAIGEVVKKGDMPPARYVEKNPAAALSQEQKDAIGKWAEEEANKLMGQGN